MHTSESRRILIFGGSFNPVHAGHLRTALFVRDSLDAQKVLLMPNAAPPHRVTAGGTSFRDRAEMLRLAIRETGDPSLELSLAESDASRPHFTFDTLSRLKNEDPSADLCFVMGMDSLLSLHTWKRGLELVELADIAVLRRPGFSEKAMPESVRESLSAPHERRYIMLDGPLLDFSSSEVRAALKTLRSEDSAAAERSAASDYLQAALPISVLEYIRERELYA